MMFENINIKDMCLTLSLNSIDHFKPLGLLPISVQFVNRVGFDQACTSHIDSSTWRPLFVSYDPLVLGLVM